jgi:hypothetical protein
MLQGDRRTTGFAAMLRNASLPIRLLDRFCANSAAANGYAHRNTTSVPIPLVTNTNRAYQVNLIDVGTTALLHQDILSKSETPVIIKKTNLTFKVDASPTLVKFKTSNATRAIHFDPT